MDGRRLVSGGMVLLLLMAGAGGLAADTPPTGSFAFGVAAFGAKGDGVAKDTAAVQGAIDACAAGGGGAVYFAPGTYLCGSLHLKSGVTLWLDPGATIKGSSKKEDFDPYEQLDFENDADQETTYFHHALIWGEDVERIGIVGGGTVDGNRKHRGGPKPIALKRCRFVRIEDIRIVNAPNYCISMLGTDDVSIEGVTIRNAYCDGIDPDACRNVRISNCHIESVDDAIVPKASFSLGKRRSTENITVTNCVLATECNCFKLGTESGGDFKRIAVSNCVMLGLRGEPATGGIALESVDGANVDGVVVSNISMVNVRAPIFIRLGNRGRDMDVPVPGTLRNVAISNVMAADASITCTITGIPEHPVQDVTLSNVHVTYRGGTPYCAPEASVPEMADQYPDADMFDALPAYGLYCRHVEGLTLSNVRLAFGDGFWRLETTRERDVRWLTRSGAPEPSAPGRPGHGLFCDDVSRLCIDGLQVRPSPEGDALLRFVNVRQALVRGCVAAENTALFLEVAGSATAGVSLAGNELRGAGKTLALGEGVKPDAVVVASGNE